MKKWNYFRILNFKMIDYINQDPVAFGIVAGSLEEEGIRVAFGESLIAPNGEVDFERVVVLKPDAFYNTKDFATPPKSPDGIVVVKNDDKIYIYIAELKSSPLKNIKKRDIIEKFDTIFSRFLIDDFKHIFMEFDYDLKNLSLWLVCDPTNIRSSVDDPDARARKIKARGALKGVLTEFVSSFKPYTFRGITSFVVPMVSPPTIECDHFTDCLAE
ncbi:hypothetical protein [Pseudomonas oryzihabitans]|uniref:hypothetical protein n=1 Tax=Pseudomonas oryzihabitans TaxID=47885 RepID=UPI00286621EE|nr:hypothetical protein [Pseudomonas psychrotolerans]MDR6677366.1 hypothetical protein [Pseudomonas psychrotolerans]